MTKHLAHAPDSPVRPEHNRIGGIEYDDPYQWLEDDTDEVRAWQAAQNAHTTGLLSEELAAALRPHVDATFIDTHAYFAPREIGGKWWWQRRPEGRRFQVLEVSDAPDAPARVVFDANASADGTEPLIQAWEPSPDGTLLYLSLSDAGQPAMHRVLDAASGEVRFDRLDGHVLMACWAPDSKHLYYTAMEFLPGPDGSPRPVTRLHRQALTGGCERSSEPVDFPHPAVWPRVSADGRYLLAMMDQTAARPAYVKDLATGTWQPFLRDLVEACKGHVFRDSYVAVTTLNAPRGRVVAIPLAGGADPGTWRTLVPESDARIAGVTPLGDSLVLAEFVRGRARLRVVDADGRHVADVPLPGEGAVGKSGVGHLFSIIDDVVYAGDSGMSFVYASITRSPSAFRWTPYRGLVELSRPRAVLGDVSVEEFTAPSRDGSPVLYRVYRPRGAGANAPTVVNGYGGFNLPYLPAYEAMGAAWLHAGGVWVHAHLRGGGEFGTDWWQAGRMRRKQGTFDDLHAVAQDLIARGITSPAKLAVFGSSNGGLLAGAVAVQRPELYAAAVSQVPILDLLRYKKDAQTYAIALADYGDPDQPDDARALYACSPYHNVAEGVRYPAVLLDAGAHDTHCPPWHARKMAARLQRATRGDRPVLLRVREQSGHNTMSEAQVRERILEELTFLAAQVGLQPR